MSLTDLRLLLTHCPEMAGVPVNHPHNCTRAQRLDFWLLVRYAHTQEKFSVPPPSVAEGFPVHPPCRGGAVIIWDKENDDVSDDDLRLARRQRPLDGGDELPHADRPRAAGSDLGRVITPELVFFSIMTGFGLILIAGTLLGLVEVGP